MEKYIFNCYNIEVSIETFTPALAAKILNTVNIQNRNISNTRVETYVRDIKAGNWKFNGDLIRFDTYGTLIDGQHRLSAVVKSGESLDFLVVRGIDPSFKKTIDTGKARTGGDALAIEVGVGSMDSKTISSAITAFNQYKSSNGFGGWGGGSRLTNSEVVNLYRDKKKLVDSSLSWLKENANHRGVILPKSELLFIHMVFSELDLEDANEFLKKVITGVNLEIGDTELHLREILIETKMKTRKLNRSAVINTIFKCWNAKRRGSGIKHKNNCVWSSVRDKKVIAY